ncbi:carbohydrate ABC transporter permease [Bauldia sp.]|uniref:carbohydrate ABC transporter permease n=1 Tax=Bauldia sp. TaxID=2575872 RepID=UPI003BADB9DD
MSTTAPTGLANGSIIGRVLRAPGDLLGRISENRHWAYLLIIPSIIFIFIIIIYPTISGIVLSFREMRLTRPDLGTGFVGLRNYQYMIEDPVFWVALLNTVKWAAAAVILEFLLGLAAALTLNRDLPGMKVIAVLILLPWFLPNVVAGNIWALMLDPRLGVLNDILVQIGILAEGKAWFADPDTALSVAILVEAWHGYPFFALLFLAALKGIPKDLYKAAAVDGAGAFQSFWQITLPGMKMVIAAVVILRVIGLVNSPELLLILTGGGPGNATQVLSLYAFQTAYLLFDFGYAGALSVVAFVVLMTFCVVYLRVSGVAR